MVIDAGRAFFVSSAGSNVGDHPDLGGTRSSPACSSKCLQGSTMVYKVYTKSTQWSGADNVYAISSGHPRPQLGEPPPLPGGNITSGNNTAPDRLYLHTTEYNDNAHKGNSSFFYFCPPSHPSWQPLVETSHHGSFNHTLRAADSAKEGKQELVRRKYAADDCLEFENNLEADGRVMDEWINGWCMDGLADGWLNKCTWAQMVAYFCQNNSICSEEKE